MVHELLIRPYFWGGYVRALGGAQDNSELDGICAESYRPINQQKLEDGGLIER